MNTETDILKNFLEKIRSLTFFQRLFSWKSVRNGLIDAGSALTSLVKSSEQLQSSKTELNNRLIEADTNCRNLKDNVLALEKEASALKEKIQNAEQKFNDATKECIRLTEKEQTRVTEHSNAMATLNKISTRIQQEREQEINERHENEVEKLKKLKETWITHESNVKICIKNICNRHTIDYVEKVPFKGEPDNCIKIGDEYIVFDAKSPGGEDAANFFTYIKTQAEKACKYAKEENVKPDIYFVVPANTAAYIKEYAFYLGDYNVYIIFSNSLEPLILTLKKIESYEFAEQLSPEERENICRVIGRFAHLTKRRIQIDSFFAKQFMEIVYKCESSLPEDILHDVAAFERSEKLNPPMEKRTKAINSKQLEIEINEVEADAMNKGIVMEDLSDDLNKVRLYRE